MTNSELQKRIDFLENRVKKLEEKDKLRFKDKICMSELRDLLSKNKLRIDILPKEILLILLKFAVERIDEKENGGEFDERDWKDCLCDKKFIVDELLERLQQEIDLHI